MDLVVGVTDEEIEELVAALRERRLSGEAIHPEEIADLALWAGRSRSTVRRWIRDGRGRPTRQRFVVTDTLQLELALRRGRVATTVRQLRQAGWLLPTVRTVQKAVVRDVAPAQRLMWAQGEKAARSLELTLRQVVSKRNEVWHLDAFHCRRRVLTANGRGIVDAYAILVIDAASGALAGVLVVRGEPDTDDFLHAMQEAMRPDPAIGPVRGAPQMVVHDNAGAMTSERFWRSLRRPALKVRCVAIPPYTPRANGKVERAVGTMRTLLATPLENGSLETLDGSPLIPSERTAVRLKELIGEMRHAAAEYNQLPYRDDARLTKAEAYEGRLTGVINPVSPEVLSGFLRRTRATVRSAGVTIDRETYLHARLRKHVGTGRYLEVRYRDMDDQEVEVWYAGKRLCVAHNVKSLPSGARGGVTLTRYADREARLKAAADVARVAETRAEASRMRLADDEPARPGPLGHDPRGEMDDDE
jgi:hypothetical protein